jgi:hypothetical protein
MTTRHWPIDFATCRFCKRQEPTYNREWGRTNLWKYGVRHYAHAECGMRAQGAGFFDHFDAQRLKAFPYLIVVELGLRDEFERRLA